MKHQAMRGELQFGWNPELNIRSAVDMVDPLLLTGCHAMVSVLDSTPGVRRLPSLLPLLRSLRVVHEEVGDDVAIPGTVLRSLIDEHDFFTGFDEIYLFHELPTRMKPDTFRITSDVPFGSPAPSGLADWMDLASCIAALGDGIGLNFATFDPTIAALWQR